MFPNKQKELDYLLKENPDELNDSYEFTSYEIIDFIEKLKEKNEPVNLVGNFPRGSLLDAVKTLYLYSCSNHQRYLLTNNARAVLRESLFNSEFNSLSALSVEEFNFIHEFNNFKMKNIELEKEEEKNLEKLNLLIENHINSFSF